ncbi:inositol monophosphatase [Shinella daejeonensis]|uniref:inositol monophosphatase family protein n=1 Tax=Shinella daejeonensis TaxID=659017 RepID=UPI0020C775FD|nr:inositol monophosphatase [Shinella daejeonensis]MCP8895870.1 inositol monophosphatase [Shinella daejeonensis]
MPDTAGLSARYDFALRLISDAGDLARGYFRKRDILTIHSKGVQDMASEADLNTELLIRERLEKAFPQDAFLGEETGQTAFGPGQGIWVVDPIDGTQPFISGLSGWCVSIAFVQEGELRFGMVYAPERGELFAGGIGFPATLNGEPVGRHPGRSIRDGMIAFGYSTRLPASRFLPAFSRFLERGGMFYRDGSGALGLCYVAAGRLLGYAEMHINSWDCLGALAVIRAAGLKTSDFLAGDGLTRGNPLIAANEDVYRELAEILQI